MENNELNEEKKDDELKPEEIKEKVKEPKRKHRNFHVVWVTILIVLLLGVLAAGNFAFVLGIGIFFIYYILLRILKKGKNGTPLLKKQKIEWTQTILHLGFKRLVKCSMKKAGYKT